MSDLGRLEVSKSISRPGEYVVTPGGRPGEVLALVATEELARCLCDAWNSRQGGQPAQTNDFKLTP